MNHFAYLVAKRFRAHWLKFLATVWVGYVALVAVMLIEAYAEISNVASFLLLGPVLISAYLLMLSGLFELSGPPNPSWSLSQRFFVGLTSFVLLLGTAAVIPLVLFALL